MAVPLGYNGVNFRSTLGFVTDDAADTFMDARITTLTIPGPIGLTVAWNNVSAGSAANENAAYNPHIAGRVSNASSGQLVVTGFTPGKTYKCKGGWGHDSSGGSIGFQAWQGTSAGGTGVTDTVLAHAMDYGTALSAGQFIDAIGGVHASNAAFIAADFGGEATFVPTGTSICFFRSSGFATNHMRYLGFKDPAAGGGGSYAGLVVVGC